MSASGIDAVAFDVNETLFSLVRLRPAFADVGLDPHLVELWFATVLRDGFALAALGGYRPFAEVAAEALRGLDGRIDEAGVATVAAALRQMRPHSDVAPALAALRAAGVPAATLTNGSAEVVAVLLERAGLAGQVIRNLSVDAVRRWKPAAEPYRYAARELGVAPQRMALVAVHPWDCAGAAAAGLRAAWVRRGRTHWPAVFPAPEFSCADLPAVVEALPSGHPQR